MIYKCPGSQAFSRPHPEFIKCPFCREEIEIWSDETKARCQKCRKFVTRSLLQSCLDWCRYAKECAGEKAYDRYIKQSKSKKGLNNSRK